MYIVFRNRPINKQFSKDSMYWWYHSIMAPCYHQTIQMRLEKIS